MKGRQTPGGEVDPDAAFFSDHPDRSFRIRETAYEREYAAEFLSLGPHNKNRRRIIVSRVPHDPRARMMATIAGVDFMRIPLLLFADETVEDRDDVLRPIFEEIMQNAARGYGMSV